MVSIKSLIASSVMLVASVSAGAIEKRAVGHGTGTVSLYHLCQESSLIHASSTTTRTATQCAYLCLAWSLSLLLSQGACGEYRSDSDYIVALNSAEYDGGANCGKTVSS